jgi:hypothetical protein
MSAATVRVRFAFELSETLPRVTACLLDFISDKKELIEFGDLKIFEL